MNVLDIVMIVDAALEYSSLAECEENAADANNDGNINVLDVITFVDFILSGNQGEDCESCYCGGEPLDCWASEGGDCCNEGGDDEGGD